jgi:hypothetical protein
MIQTYLDDLGFILLSFEKLFGLVGSRTDKQLSTKDFKLNEA